MSEHDQLVSAFREILTEGDSDTKLLLIQRVPFICQDIKDIKEMLGRGDKRINWLEKMIYLAIGGLSILTVIVLPLMWTLIGSGKI